jgi:hypothetical protein
MTVKMLCPHLHVASRQVDAGFDDEAVELLSGAGITFFQLVT